MRLLSLIVCIVAAYLLVETPLAALAAVVAAANAIFSVSAIVAERRTGRPAPRLLTALGHVTTALGGFFLFVWFNLPSGG